MDKSKKLKEKILENYSSVLDFSKQVGIPCSTLQSALDKVNGIDNMGAGRVLKICDELELDPNTMNPLDKKAFYLGEDEKNFIKKYRQLDEHGRHLINTVADLEIDRVESGN